MSFYDMLGKKNMRAMQFKLALRLISFKDADNSLLQKFWALHATGFGLKYSGLGLPFSL